MPDGRIRASYFPAPRIWSRIFFSFSRKFTRCCVALNEAEIEQKNEENVNKKFNFEFPIDIKMFMSFVDGPRALLLCSSLSLSLLKYMADYLWRSNSHRWDGEHLRALLSSSPLMSCRYTRAWLNFKMSKRWAKEKSERERRRARRRKNHRHEDDMREGERKETFDAWHYFDCSRRYTHSDALHRQAK